MKTAMTWLALLATSALHAEEQPTRAGIQFFETYIRPLLAEHCYDCHGPDKQKGGLRLDHMQHIQVGGSEFGPAVNPGHGETSPLMLAVSHTDPDLEMPPDDPLNPAQVELLREWIDMGAPWPDEPVEGDVKKPVGQITDEDRAWWAFQPVQDTSPPRIDGASAIDAFILDRLAADGLTPALPASRVELLRRLTFDLTGLPPTPEQAATFLNDTRPNAYEQLVDDLLASPHHGERAAQHWLDLVRYAESDGYRQDAFRDGAWAYRDYVIRSFNDDKPFDQFVREQIAGDEIAPTDPDAVIGTAFLRHGIYEYNQRDAEGQWKAIVNEMTDVTGDVFMGMSMQCAQCHDHKFDPILQKDYYRLQAFFNNVTWPEDQVLATPTAKLSHDQQLQNWKIAAAAPLAEIDRILQPRFDKAAKNAMEKFPAEVQAMYAKPPHLRTPYEEQVVRLAYRQALYEHERFKTESLPKEDQERLAAAQDQLKAFDSIKPKPLQKALVIGETGPTALPASFSTRKAGVVKTEPGFLTLLAPDPANIPSVPNNATTSGRRTVLAEWMTSPDNPLVPRVIVNRIWQQHFGRGLVATTSDFGRLGEAPTHPELLDWLTSRFIESGWSIKALRKAIVTSRTYQQTARREPSATESLTDPENKLLWRFPARRLDAEQVRDAALMASGELDLTLGGPSVSGTTPRRSIYVRKMRNTPDEVLASLDAPAGFSSQPKREATTTATQSLMLFNGDWMLDRAQAMAGTLSATSTGTTINDAYLRLLNRRPTTAETSAAEAFVRQQTAALQSELPPPSSPTPTHPSTPIFPAVSPLPIPSESLRFTPGTDHERLQISNAQVEPDAFTIEAVLQLDSLYPDATVRSIAGRWNNDKTKRGWVLGVTSTKSAYQPNNLIVQLIGEDFQGTLTYEVVASGLRIPIGKPYYVAAVLGTKPGPNHAYGGTIAFYALDLSDPKAQMQTATISHEIVGGWTSPTLPLIVGGRDTDRRSLWHGSMARLRLHSGVKAPPPFAENATLLTDIHARSPSQWISPATASTGKPGSPTQTALADLCHALLNANEFFYLH